MCNWKVRKGKRGGWEDRSVKKVRLCFFSYPPIFLSSIVTIFLSSYLPILVSAQEIHTYYKDIQPIITKNCLACHRMGEAAPFSLETYEDVERRADFIQMVTESRYMPPWYADPEFRHFKNEKRLTDTEIQAIAAWVQQGKKRGKPSKQTSTTALKNYPQPDLIIPMNQPFTIPADGSEQFRLFVMPTHTKEELFVKGIDFRPSNLKLAHHARVMLDTTHVFRADDGAVVGDTVKSNKNLGVGLANYFWHGWVPGNFLTMYPDGFGKRLPPDADMVLNIHYSPTTKVETDQSKILVYLTKEKPRRLIETFTLDESWVTNQPFQIPANREVKFYMRSPLLPYAISLVHVLPHAHLLCKNFKAYAITPQGEIVNLIKIDDWNFNWQMTYQFEKLIKLPKGTVIYAEAVYDNTSNNPRNPHFPPKDVTYGWDTFNEMMNLIFEYLMYEAGDENLDLFQSKP